MRAKRFLAVDLGSSYIRAASAVADEEGELIVEGVREGVTEGLNKGVIVNLAEIQEAIRKVIGDLSYETESLPSEAIVNIGGVNLGFLKGIGLYTSQTEKNVISQTDVDKAVESANSSIQMPYGKFLLHSIVEEFVVNNVSGIRNPLNLIGNRIEAKVLLLTAAEEKRETLRLAFQKAGLDISKLYYTAYADGSAVLGDEEKQSGTILIDVGNEECNAIVYQKGNIAYAGGIPFGSSDITSDIQYILRRSRSDANTIKENMGVCYLPMVDRDAMLEIPESGTMERFRIPQSEIAQIMYARVAEILIQIKEKINAAVPSGVYAQGVVLTGGGCLLKGFAELCMDVFRLPVHIGTPRNFKGLQRELIDSRYTCVMGLVKTAYDDYRRECLATVSHEPEKAPAELSPKGSIWGKIRKLF